MKILEKIRDLMFRGELKSLRCPHCDNDQLWMGPEGGGSVNVTCSRCRSRYNYMGPFGLQELEIRNEHKDYLRDKKLEEILK